MVRGGSWFDVAGYCRSAYRNHDGPSYRLHYLGFRLARDGAWRSDPFPLGGAPKASEMPAGAVDRTPHEGFRDRLASGVDAPEVVYVPGETFKMGDIQGDGPEDERPVHDVSLDDFAIGRYPVTVGEYLRFVESTDSHQPEWLEEGNPYHLESGEHDHYRNAGVEPRDASQPVVGISWEDAAAYCRWLSEQTGEPYSLLTEAEWEYACRAGSETDYSFGDDADQLGEYAWYEANSEGKIHPIGHKRANAWGMHGMHGTVEEWVQDRHGDYLQELQSNPSGPVEGSTRVVRGGSWFYDAEGCRSACRFSAAPDVRDRHIGFRLARRV